MLFNAVIAAAILASTAIAAPQPPYKRTPLGTGVAPPPAAATGPSVTQQLFLADNAIDRFTILSQNENFVFSFDDPAKRVGANGDIIAATRKTFPALVGSGSGMAVGFLEGCAFNTPHVHPRATELQIVIEGTVVTEMVPENGVFNIPGDAKSGRRVIKNTLKPFQMQPFYQGSIHSQFNPDCAPATFIASFNAEDFGAGSVLDEVFALDPETVAAATGQQIPGDRVDEFQGLIPASVAQGVKDCLARCPPASRK